MIPICASIFGLLFYNYLRFGDFLDFGYATMNVGENIAVLQTYGQFNISFMKRNFYYMFLSLPKVSKSCLGRLVPDPEGISIFVTTPALFYLVKSFRKSFLVIGAWISIVLQVILLLMHTGSAWEFGYRYVMDFFIPMLVLLAVTSGPRISKLMRILIGCGIIVNFYGVLWYFGLWCPV
jgi:hypothetical protein